MRGQCSGPCGGSPGVAGVASDAGAGARDDAGGDEPETVVPGWGTFGYDSETQEVRVRFDDRALLYLQASNRFEVVLPTGEVVASRLDSGLATAHKDIECVSSCVLPMFRAACSQNTFVVYRCYIGPALEYRAWRQTPPSVRADLEDKRHALKVEAVVALRRSQRFLAISDIRKRCLQDCSDDSDDGTAV